MQWKTERSWQCARDMRKEVELMQTHGIAKCKSVWPVVSYLKRAVCDSRCFEAESKTFQSEREPRIGVTCQKDKRNFSLNTHLDEWSCDPVLVSHDRRCFVSSRNAPRKGCSHLTTYPFPILANCSCIPSRSCHVCCWVISYEVIICLGEEHCVTR